MQRSYARRWDSQEQLDTKPNPTMDLWTVMILHLEAHTAMDLNRPLESAPTTYLLVVAQRQNMLASLVHETDAQCMSLT